MVANNDTGNKNIFPLNMALGDSEEIIQMPIDAHQLGYTSSTVTKRIYDVDHMTQPVLTMSGDLFSKTYKQKPTHIKIDVDGAEVAILKGLKGVLKNVSTLLIEVEDDLLEQFDEVAAAYILPSGLKLCTIEAPECGRMKFFSRNEKDIL